MSTDARTYPVCADCGKAIKGSSICINGEYHHSSSDCPCVPHRKLRDPADIARIEQQSVEIAALRANVAGLLAERDLLREQVNELELDNQALSDQANAVAREYAEANVERRALREQVGRMPVCIGYTGEYWIKEARTHKGGSMGLHLLRTPIPDANKPVYVYIDPPAGEE